jgi:RimJ/RimL family protein N-acetyltransferase
MLVFLETQRLVLRRFTVEDADNLVNLDADPDVMRFVTGGVPTSRDEIEKEFLPAFLGYYERYEGMASGRSSRKRPRNSWGGFISGRVRTPGPARPSLVTGCASRHGAKGMPPRGRAR